MPDNNQGTPENVLDLLSIAQAIANTIAGNEQHAAAISLIVNECLKRGDVDRAALAADEVSDPFMRDRLLLQTAEKCSEIDDDDYALQLMDAIEDPGRRLAAIEASGIVKARRGQIEKALSLAEMHLHSDRILAEIAVYHLLEGETQKAIDIINSIEFLPAAIDALIAGAEEKTKTSETSEAVMLLERAIEAATNLEQPDDLVDKMIAIGTALTAAGRNDLAISTFEQARQATDQIEGIHRDQLLAAIALGFTNAGSESLAEIALDSIIDLTQLSSALKSISEVHRKSGDAAKADEFLDEAYEVLRSEKDTQRRDSRASFALQAAIARSFAETNKADKAIEAAESIPLEDYSHTALVSIAAAFAEQGKTDEACAILSSISNDAGKVAGLLAIADALISDPARATEFLRLAAENVDGIIQQSLRVQILGEIIGRYLKIGNLEAAANLRHSLVETLPMIRDRFVQIREILILGSIFGFEETNYSAEEIRAFLRLLND